MNIRIRSYIQLNTAIALARGQGLNAFAVNANKSVEVFKLELCDHCARTIRGANPIRLVTNPRWLNVVTGRLAACSIGENTEACPDAGCNEEGDVVCGACYQKGEQTAGSVDPVLAGLLAQPNPRLDRQLDQEINNGD